MTLQTVKHGEVYRYKGRNVTACGTYERYAWVQRTDGSKTPVRIEDLQPRVTREEWNARLRARFAPDRERKTKTAAYFAEKYPKEATIYVSRSLYLSDRSARIYMKLAGFSWTGRKTGWMKKEQPTP
jgi:hypothetical protein